MALFSYLFDSDFKKRVREEERRSDKDRLEGVAQDPVEEQATIRRLREDLARVLVLNRSLITLLINKGVITLPELAELAKEINLEEDAEQARPDSKQSKFCKDCGRPNYRSRANCVYCGSLQL